MPAESPGAIISLPPVPKELDTTQGGNPVQETRFLSFADSQGRLYGQAQSLSSLSVDDWWTSVSFDGTMEARIFPPWPLFEDMGFTIWPHYRTDIEGASDNWCCGQVNGDVPPTGDETEGGLIQSGSNIVFFDPAAVGAGSPPAGEQVVGASFFPSTVNNNGSALGWTLGRETTLLWNGSALINIPNALHLNDQNQVVTGVYPDSGLPPVEGALWENGAITILRDTLPFWFQWEVWDVMPFSISNQVTPFPPVPLAPPPNPDTTIHILSQGMSLPAVGPAGATEPMLWSRDNNGDWSFATIALPAGTTIDDWSSINSSGVIAAIGNPGTGDQHALLLLPVDVSLTFAYPANVNARSQAEQDLNTIPGLMFPPLIDGDVHTYLYQGLDPAGNKKLWTVQTSSNQQTLISALEGVPYIFFTGHSNDAAGLALKAGKYDADVTANSIATIDDFMHLRNPQVSIPWEQLHDDPTEYPQFGPNAVADAQIPAHPSNYAVTIPFSPGPILDGHGAANNERYPNEQGIHAGAIFPLPTGSSGQINRYDMTRLQDADEDDPAGGIVNFLVVNVTNEIKPPFGYKMLVADGCNSARDYGEFFNHGLFICSKAGLDYYGTEIKAFVSDLVGGQTDAVIFADLNNKTQDAFIQTSH